ncbi:MAG: sigma-70 family RNA polymerase sigma factor [Armatimonadetes bacterium]|nr:sigma-70 family RNA polymerase sigma factor [Armatimonadota bacterium]
MAGGRAQNERESVRDDSDLIRLCLAGQQGAFDALVSRHYRGIYNMIYRMLGNSEDAADVTQEAFLRAYTRLDTFELGRSFPAWLKTIASNLSIDHLRKRKTQAGSAVSLDERVEAGVQHEDERAAAPDEQVVMAEDSRRVLAAVQQLPDRQRAVLVLRHIEGMKLEEIAETLGMPLGTVKTMLFRGRAAVREMVGEL